MKPLSTTQVAAEAGIDRVTLERWAGCLPFRIFMFMN
jgi:hypothetical protein